MIETDKFSIDFLHQATKDGQRCKVELNNGDVLETSSLCSVHMVDGKPTGLGLDATGTLKSNCAQWPANMSDIATQIVTLPLASVKAITLLPPEQSQPAPLLDKASF